MGQKPYVKKVPVSVYARADELDQIDAVARAQGITRSALIRNAIQAILGKEQPHTAAPTIEELAARLAELEKRLPLSVPPVERSPEDYRQEIEEVLSDPKKHGVGEWFKASFMADIIESDNARLVGRCLSNMTREGKLIRRELHGVSNYKLAPSLPGTIELLKRTMLERLKERRTMNYSKLIEKSGRGRDLLALVQSARLSGKVDPRVEALRQLIAEGHARVEDKHRGQTVFYINKELVEKKAEIKALAEAGQQQNETKSASNQQQNATNEVAPKELTPNILEGELMPPEEDEGYQPPDSAIDLMAALYEAVDAPTFELFLGLEVNGRNYDLWMPQIAVAVVMQERFAAMHPADAADVCNDMKETIGQAYRGAQMAIVAPAQTAKMCEKVKAKWSKHVAPPEEVANQHQNEINLASPEPVPAAGIVSDYGDGEALAAYVTQLKTVINDPEFPIETNVELQGYVYHCLLIGIDTVVVLLTPQLKKRRRNFDKFRQALEGRRVKVAMIDPNRNETDIHFRILRRAWITNKEKTTGITAHCERWDYDSIHFEYKDYRWPTPLMDQFLSVLDHYAAELYQRYEVWMYAESQGVEFDLYIPDLAVLIKLIPGPSRWDSAAELAKLKQMKTQASEGLKADGINCRILFVRCGFPNELHAAACDVYDLLRSALKEGLPPAFEPPSEDWTPRDIGSWATRALTEEQVAAFYRPEPKAEPVSEADKEAAEYIAYLKAKREEQAAATKLKAKNGDPEALYLEICELFLQPGSSFKPNAYYWANVIAAHFDHAPRNVVKRVLGYLIAEGVLKSQAYGLNEKFALSEPQQALVKMYTDRIGKELHTGGVLTFFAHEDEGISLQQIRKALKAPEKHQYCIFLALLKYSQLPENPDQKYGFSNLETAPGSTNLYTGRFYIENKWG